MTPNEDNYPEKFCDFRAGLPKIPKQKGRLRRYTLCHQALQERIKLGSTERDVMSSYQAIPKTVSFPEQIQCKYVMSSRYLKILYIYAAIRQHPTISGLLCYVLGWISGIVLLFSKRQDSFIRFHAWQSIVVFGIMTIPIVVLNTLPPAGDVVYEILIVLYGVFIAFTVLLWIVLMLKAYQGQVYSLPMLSGIVSALSHVQNIKTYPRISAAAVEETRSFAAIATAPKLEPETRQEVERLKGVLTEAVRSIVTLYETRDPYTASHQNRVAQLACAIAREMGLPEDRIEGIRIMGVIHDIGKVAVPSEILSKPGKISDSEFGIIKTHPRVGYDILKGLEFPWPVAQAVLQHHERLDGSGYPNGLSGENILLEARILAVSDVVEAIAAHRPYRPALGIDVALKEISQKKGTFYDSKVVETCLTLFTQNLFKL